MCLKVAQPQCNVAITHGRHIFETVEPRDQTRAQVAAVVAAKRNRDDVEPRSIVLLDEPGEMISNRMPPKVRR